MISPNLKDFLAMPQSPWRVSQGVSDRLQVANPRFKSTVLLPDDPEAKMILRHFMADKPPGYSIGKITYVYNRSLQMGFLAHLCNIEQAAQKFPPAWNTESLAAERQDVIDSWKALTDPFSPLKVTIDQEEEILSHAKVLPVWHGTSVDKSQSICETGFTYFGKHAYFAGGHASDSTDIGYFGSGMYFTESAKYAGMYSKGALLFSWVSMREPFPVVSDVPHPSRCQDMKMLEGRGAYKNYDSHFIPVAPTRADYCLDFFPCYQRQAASWHEIVVFQTAQTLPCFIVETDLDFLPAPSNVYTFDACYAACQAGDFPLVKSWIEEDKKHLLETNAQGENFLFAAVVGKQLPLLRWLSGHDCALLSALRKDGWSLLHVAASHGHIDIVNWLHGQIPTLIHSGKVTPIHIAAFAEQTEILQPFLNEVTANTQLIEQIVQRPCPLTLKLLVDNGINPNQSNRFKQSLLHLAAQSGQVTQIELLLEKGAEINAQDLSQKTPLYLAVVHGHLSAIKCLLDKGADPTIVGIEGDTVLHVAAFYGYTPIVSLLLKYPLLHCVDEDGKQPIHKAVWGHPKPDVVKLLLDAGANPNAVNKFGYTPLHWTAKHGHIESAQVLIKGGAISESVNQNHDLPFDLAVKWGQDEFVRSFLGIQPKNTPEPAPQDIEAHYWNGLFQAKRDAIYQEQIFYLEKLSDLYVQKKNWTQAVKILNGALAILTQNSVNPSLRAYLLARLERIEALFIETQGFKVPHQHRGTVLNYRTWLKNIRTLYIKHSIEGHPIHEIISDLSGSYKKLLGTLILDSQELLGPPPVKWACVGMGSMARGEMCPYSDLEFAFLIAKKSDENLQYFRTLAGLLELRIINLGETAFPLFGKLFGEKSTEASPTPTGLSMDSDGNTPLVKPGFYELIDTPQELAQFQSVKWMDADLIVTNALSSVCFIAGDQKLLESYNNAKQNQHGDKESFFSGTPFCQKLSLKLLEGHLREFKPNLSPEKEEARAISIKNELYRPFQSLLNTLSLFCGFTSQSSFAMINQLLKNNTFCPEGAKNLTKALCQVFTLRFEAHNFYQTEGEFLFHIEEGKPQNPHCLYLNDTRLSSLHEIYKVLIPFHACAKEFLRTQDLKVFRKSPFYKVGGREGA